MALILTEGPYDCALCDRKIEKDEDYFETTFYAWKDELSAVDDNIMHHQCLIDWEHRDKLLFILNMDQRRCSMHMQIVTEDFMKRMYVIENNKIVLVEGQMIQPIAIEKVKYSYMKPNNSWTPIWTQAFSKFFRKNPPGPEIETDELESGLITVGIFNLLDEFHSFYPSLVEYGKIWGVLFETPN